MRFTANQASRQAGARRAQPCGLCESSEPVHGQDGGIVQIMEPERVPMTAGSAEEGEVCPPLRLANSPPVRGVFRTAIQCGGFHRWCRRRDRPPIIGLAPASARKRSIHKVVAWRNANGASLHATRSSLDKSERARFRTAEEAKLRLPPRSCALTLSPRARRLPQAVRGL
jgi:hypothetical protein